MTSITLGALAAELRAELHGASDLVLRGVRHDSRQVQAGDLFVAISGQKHEGARFLPDAAARGAVAVLSDRRLETSLPQLVVANVRWALAQAAAQVYGDPTRRLRSLGITGTNGKTTTSWMIDAILRASGAQTALVGTVQTRLPQEERAAAMTTPEADDLMRFCCRALEQGSEFLTMEVSSHALALHRVDGVHFEVGAFSNLTPDHLDFHGDMESYGRAKARLITDLAPAHSVVNIDDPFVRRVAAEARGQLWTCSLSGRPEAALRVLEWGESLEEGLWAEVESPQGALTLRAPYVGRHNLENLLLAVGSVMALGFEREAILRALPMLPPVPGRLQRVPNTLGFSAIVDYAHTPDALARVLEALRPTTAGRLFLVFGCGGDRDRSKRPLMGEVAARDADLVIVTSDNPRSEDPESILRAIEGGMGTMPKLQESGWEAAERGYLCMADRRQAIARAVAALRPGDSVLVAGKGHEDYQILGSERVPFSDTQELAQALLARQERGA